MNKRPSPTLAGLAGLLSAFAALAMGELVASIWNPNPGPVVAVANRVVDRAPGWFVEFGKSVFGLGDKPALIAGTILISALLGLGFGLASRNRAAIGALGIAAFGVVGAASIAVDSQGTLAAGVVIALLSVVAGIVSLKVLLKAATPTTTSASNRQRTPANEIVPFGQTPAQLNIEAIEGAVLDNPSYPAVSRRGFLGWAGAVGIGAAAATGASRSLRSRAAVEGVREAVTLNADPVQSAQQLMTAAASDPVAKTPGITPIVMPNDDFYLIDTALTRPQIDPRDGWSLTIKGLVDREITLDYDDLLERATTVAPVTLSCVSNPVGGDLVGNALWQGVPLAELLDEAGVKPESTQIASRSVDGWTCGFPTEAAFDGRTALVAIGMNGEPLPVSHGFPARLVVSGLYGYVSATKWLKEIELTTFEDFDGYWIPRGWSKSGPVKTQSRIDTPRNGDTVPIGEPITIAGVAWAPNVGVTKVEVQVNDQSWQSAELGDAFGADAWRQWVTTWEATEGVHTIKVRATDATGQTQTSDLAPPAPNGATGWHEVRIRGAA